MNLQITFLVALLLVGTKSIEAKVKYTKCKGGGVKPTHVEIEGCDKAPCYVYGGKPVRANVTFTARKYYKSAYSYIL